MSVATFEGTVENGQIRLEPGVRLPENTKVYLLVPDAWPTPAAWLRTPHLAQPELAADFAMEIIEPDAGV